MCESALSLTLPRRKKKKKKKKTENTSHRRTVKLVVAQLDLAVPVRALEVDVHHALRHARLGRHLGLHLERDRVGHVHLHPARHAAVREHAADGHVAARAHQIGPKLVRADGHLQRGRARLGGDVRVAHEEGVADRKVLVERLGEVEAQALEQVGLQGHCDECEMCVCVCV
jgi:hypothetical protein